MLSWRASMAAFSRWLQTARRGLELAAEDIRAICENDPAARSRIEVVLVYPGLHAVWLHRAAHWLWQRELKLSARVLSNGNRFLTGIEIHPGARVGRRVVIDHGMGIVIGETASVGDGCLLYKGVVLGGTSTERKVRHPQVGNEVVIGSNACILGAIHVGDRARIGSGSVVVRDVPAEATVVGVPARLIVPRHATLDAALDHANLPDPVAEMIRALAEQNEKLRERISALEDKLGVAYEELPLRLPYDGDALPRADGG
ncbi:MAG TPA: serine O-acetyltransferase [Polyangiaceae bacterium]|nr:serine O-acetyltransferase [Polyangiaceae bacterium]